MNATLTEQWIDSLLEAYQQRLEEEIDVCPKCIANELTNDNVTAMLSDAYAAGKGNPMALVDNLLERRAVIMGMAQIIEDCLVATYDVFSDEIEGTNAEDVQRS
jgi:uncharacterized protein CbrC (UPF0167 family)